MKHLLLGVAALALAVGPALADPGNGNGKGNGNAAHGPSMKAAGPGKADNGTGNRADRGTGMTAQEGPSMKAVNAPAMKDNRGNAMRAANGPSMRDDHGPGMKAARADDRGPAMKPGNRNNGNGNGNGNGKSNGAGSEKKALDWREDMQTRADVRRQDQTYRGRVGDRAGVRVLDDGRRVYSSRDARDGWGEYDQRGLIDGCPPGLAKKRNGCMPPGLAKARDPDYRYRYVSYRPDWWGLSNLGLGSGNFFYDDGYLLRYNGDNVLGYVPLLGGALSVGNPWPDSYAPRPVPPYYVNYYGLDPQGGYRYADDVLYRVDPQTQAITSIAALLTGDDIQVGSPMPMGYDVYNVPYPYRSQYVDGPQAQYRYSDGYVYQVDPKTRLVAAAIELLAT